MISIIVPNYNHAAFLRRRIDSILAQTYQDFELILLDDCSTDESVSVLREYESNPHVSHIVVNEVNTGSPFLQWQRGFDLARGEYICIAESDDWWEPTILETLLNGMQDGVVLSVCQSNVVTDEGKIIYRTEFGCKDATILNGVDFVRRYLYGDTLLVNSGMCMFRKEALSGLTGEHRNYKSAGDWMFWVQIALQGQVAVAPVYLNNFRRNISTVSSRAERTGVDMLEGNQINRFIASRVHPNIKERWKAMKFRFALYERQLSMYESEDLKQTLFDDLMKSDWLARPMYWLWKWIRK